MQNILELYLYKASSSRGVDLLPNANNNFTITTDTVQVQSNQDEVAVTLDAAVHPISKQVSVVVTARGTHSNQNVFIKSLSNSSGSWVITFGLSTVSDASIDTSIDYMVYSSVV